jgi:hypothetical protein
MTQTFSKGSPYKRPALWEQPDVLRQFQDHVLETTKNAFSLDDTKRHVAHNSSYVSFMRKGRTAKEQADATRNETDDTVNLGMHPYRYSSEMQAAYESHITQHAECDQSLPVQQLSAGHVHLGMDPHRYSNEMQAVCEPHITQHAICHQSLPVLSFTTL